MHTLLKVTMTDMVAANAAIQEGRFQKIIQQLTNTIKPESTFFYSENGFRAALFTFDMKDASLIPQIAEPLFSGLNARVEFFPAMDMNELTQGLAEWHKQMPGHISLS